MDVALHPPSALPPAGQRCSSLSIKSDDFDFEFAPLQSHGDQAPASPTLHSFSPSWRNSASISPAQSSAPHLYASPLQVPTRAFCQERPAFVNVRQSYGDVDGVLNGTHIFSKGDAVIAEPCSADAPVLTAEGKKRANSRSLLLDKRAADPLPSSRLHNPQPPQKPATESATSSPTSSSSSSASSPSSPASSFPSNRNPKKNRARFLDLGFLQKKTAKPSDALGDCRNVVIGDVNYQDVVWGAIRDSSQTRSESPRQSIYSPGSIATPNMDSIDRQRQDAIGRAKQLKGGRLTETKYVMSAAASPCPSAAQMAAALAAGSGAGPSTQLPRPRSNSPVSVHHAKYYRQRQRQVWSQERRPWSFLPYCPNILRSCFLPSPRHCLKVASY